MKTWSGIALGVMLFGVLAIDYATAHQDDPPQAATKAAALNEPTRSTPGRNEWNKGREPKDWWGEIVRYHGHMGPWNVMGWRMGRAALRELDAQWGDHSLEIVCHLPLATPYTCLADGLTVATGNSIGRLDIRLAEEQTTQTLHVSVRRKGGGPALEFWPNPGYITQIERRPVSEMEAFSHRSAEMKEPELFTVKRY